MASDSAARDGSQRAPLAGCAGCFVGVARDLVVVGGGGLQVGVARVVTVSHRASGGVGYDLNQPGSIVTECD